MKKSKLQFKIQKYLKFLLLTYTFGFCLFPFDFVLASIVYIDTSHQDFFVGDTIMFSVRVDSQNKNINVVEGSVILDHGADTASLVGINTAGSQFSLWPGKPSPSENNESISFAGGTPLGLNSKDAIIFNFVLKLEDIGKIALSPTDFSVYLNDGKGTKDAVSVRSLVIDVLPKRPDSQHVDDWNSLTSNDRTPPEPFEIYLGQDGTVFDGKKFLSFSTTDNQSGIAYYEVTEGDLPPVRSDGTYILREQNKPVKVTVIAYDSAGNARESIYMYSPERNNVLYPIIIIVLLALILAFVIYKKRRNRLEAI